MDIPPKEYVMGRYREAEAYYNKCMENLDTDNSHQKFPIGAMVMISKDLGPTMRHFRSGCMAKVLYTSGQAYGGNYDAYCLEINGDSSSWYEEGQLTGC